MKNFLFTIIATILVTATITAESFTAPLDTINEKSSSCIFEMNDESIRLSDLGTNLNIIDLGEEFIEESSRSMIVNLKPVPKNYTGYKVEIIKVYHQPLDYSNAIFTTYDNVMIERIGESQFTYLVGEFKNSKEATAFISKLASANNATVVQYKNGVKVN